MAKNSPNKRKTQNNEVQTPKKQKLNEGKQNTPATNKTKTPKGANKSVTKNTPKKDKLHKFSGTANLKDKEEDANSAGEESDYEVEQEVKPEKITKTMNEGNGDSDDSKDDDEEIENAVNENSENDEKKQKKKNGNQPKVHKTEDIKAFIESESAKGKMRYVLFVGNLPFVITIDDIKNHFKNGINIKSVRLPKGKGPDNKPRGFGYLEVEDKESYIKALSMHHTFLNGRRINVLYTTGGKKKSEKIKSIIKSKNFKLDALRKGGVLDGKKHSQKRSVRRAKKHSFEKKTD